MTDDIKRQQRAILVSMGLLIAICGVAGFIPRHEPSTPVDRGDPAAWHACKGLILRELDSPSSATFGQLDRKVEKVGDYRWRIRSWVDSDNVFGANIRKHFTAVVREVPGQGAESTWYLESLDID